MEPHLFSIFMDVLLALHEAAQRRAPVESAFLSIVAQMDSRMTDAQRAALQVDIKGYQSRLMKKSIEEDAHRRREAEDYQTIVKEFATRDGEEMGLGDGYA